jgi:lysyl-tRNA synthetase class 2
MDTELVVKARHDLLRSIREFFYGRDFLEVETPNLMRTLSPDPYIDPVTVYVGKMGPLWLHTSPEMGMKRLMGALGRPIFEICKVYRVEELTEIHNTEFTMLEWYRPGTYLEIMAEVEEMICFVVRERFPERSDGLAGPYRVYDLGELFLEKTGIDPFRLDRDGLFGALGERGFRGIDGEDTWNDLFFKVFIQEVEPGMGAERPYFIKDWPSSISTMAKRTGERKVERFELYINGLEIANGYTELLDPREQRRRFEEDNLERKRLGKDTFPVDEEFLSALRSVKGPLAGVSVGLDRLLMVLLGRTLITDVLPGKQILITANPKSEYRNPSDCKS